MRPWLASILAPVDPLTAGERQRLADRDVDVAKLTATIDALRAERYGLVDLARRRNEHAAHYAADAAQARRDRDRYATRVHELEQELAAVTAGKWKPPRPEACSTLAECSGNRALAERVTRVVGDGDTAAAADRVIVASGCAPRPGWPTSDELRAAAGGGGS